MGFCARCGDLVNGQTSRCRCGGRPRDGSVQVSPGAKEGNKDRWSRTYTSKEKSPSPVPASRGPRTSSTLPPLGMLNMDFNKDEDVSPPPRTPPPSDALGTSHTNLAALPPVQRSPNRRSFPKPLNHSSRVGPRSTTTTSRPSSPLKQAYIPPKHDTPPRFDRQEQSTVATDDDLPSIADEELGDLTNTLGSTIQPKDTLPVQLCAGCETPFETDDVRYPDLDDPRGITGVFYCRQCFKDNGGLKGHCDACGLEVLMGRHDGSSVTVRDKLYHTKCFKCTHCGTKVERNHCCDPAGKPCCEPCLDKVLNASSGPTSPAAPRTRRKSGGGPRESDAGDKFRGSPRGPPRSSTTPAKASTTPAKAPNAAPSTPTGGNRPRESMSFLEELKQRQSAGGGAPSPSAIRRETLRSRSKSRDADRQRERDQDQEREQEHERERERERNRERDREREKKREPSRDRERDRDRDRERDREREREREREMEREHEREHDYDQEDDHEDSPVGSPINPDMIRRDTMGPRKHASAIRLRAREREREREQSSSPSPAAGRARDRDGDKPSPRSAMRSASRPRERSTSPPPPRSAKFADGHNPPSALRRSSSSGALKQKDRSTSPGARRGRNEDDSKKPTPRSALRSASRPRMSDPKPRRERERSKSPPAKDGPLYPVGKLTRDLGSLSVGIASVDDSNVSTSDSHSSIARSDWTTISSTTSGTSLRGSMSPGSVSGSDIKPALKTRRSGMRDSVAAEDSAMSESPSTSSRTRRPLRNSQIGRESFSGTSKAPSESADSFKPPTEAETEEDFDKSIGGESDFKPSTPSRLARRRSVGRDSPASTGTVTPVNRARGGTPSSGRKPTGMGDYHEPEEHRTSWLRNRDSRTRSFIGSARGDYSDTSLDSAPWSRRSTLLDDSSSSRRGSVIEPDTFSPPPAATPVSPPSTSAPAPSRRRVKVDDLVMPLDSTERCSKCNEKLHLDGGNMFVTVPGYAKTGSNGEFTPARTFHVDCFKCSVCELPFGGEAWEGQQARFVQLKDVIAHPECAPPIVRTATYTPSPTKMTNRATRTLPQPPEPSLRSAPVMPRPVSSATLPTPATSAPTVRPRSGTTGQAPRFGGSMYCPACNKSVSPMEMGTCPGPNGSRWHSSCLVCGGKDAKKNRKNPKDPGCGKQLDSGAKYDQEGGVWCRECIDKLPSDMRPSSPTKQLVPTHTGNRSLGRSGGAIVAQYTGVSVHTTGGGILKAQTTGGGGILKPQTTGGGGILKPQTTGGGGFIRPQVTGGRSAGAIPTQYTGGSVVGALVPQLTGGVPITMQLTGGQYRRAAAKSVGNFAELEEQVTGSGRPRPVSAIGHVDFHTAMSLARRGVSMDDTDDEPPVKERPKSAYGLRSWKI